MIWLGFGLAVTRIRRPYELTLILWVIVSLVLGSVVILGARNAHRILLMTPAVFVLGGVLVARASELMRATPTQRVAWLVAPLGTTLALWLLAANVAIYFYDFVPREESAESTLMARQMQQDPGRYQIYLMTQPRFDTKHGSIQYVAHGIPAQDLTSAANFRGPPTDGRGLLVLALEQHLNDLKAIEARVPGGQEERINAPNGRLLFLVYRVPPVR
jgi:hypothetical protein